MRFSPARSFRCMWLCFWFFSTERMQFSKNQPHVSSFSAGLNYLHTFRKSGANIFQHCWLILQSKQNKKLSEKYLINNLYFLSKICMLFTLVVGDVLKQGRNFKSYLSSLNFILLENLLLKIVGTYLYEYIYLKLKTYSISRHILVLWLKIIKDIPTICQGPVGNDKRENIFRKQCLL